MSRSEPTPGPRPDADVAFVQAVVAQARAAGADEAQARLSHNQLVEVDFDTRHVEMLRTTSDDDTLLTVFKGSRKGSAAITGRDADGVAGAVGAALAAAEAAPPDPANGLAESEPGPATMHGPEAADREGMIDAARAHIEQMARDLPQIVTRNAYHRFNRTRRSFANSAGLTRQETRGRYSFFTLFAARRDGRATSFNYHGGVSYAPFKHLAEVGALPQLYRDMVRSFDARPAPGKFVGDIILTPDAIEEVLIGPLVRVLGGYSLMAGTSPYKDSVGQAIASANFSLLNRPTAARFPEGIDFDAYGIPTSDLDVIKDGVLRDFLVDHYVARKLAIRRTAVWQTFVVPPGQKSVAEIVAATRRGIILTRYSGGVPSDSLDFSGIAKNAFYIEDGVVRHPLAETMISGNLRELLKAIRDVSRETIDFGNGAFPTIAAGGVTIHGR
jgi:PmbA protein